MSSGEVGLDWPQPAREATITAAVRTLMKFVVLSISGNLL
jgi:hypothetical protein